MILLFNDIYMSTAANTLLHEIKDILYLTAMTLTSV